MGKPRPKSNGTDGHGVAFARRGCLTAAALVMAIARRGAGARAADA